MSKPNQRTRVAVIGAGLAGLAATKELRELGVDVECYEQMPVLGGTFASYVWKGGYLTSSTVSTWFSDFPVEDRQAFMTWAEFVEYLESYVTHFGFRARIHLNCRVTDIRETEQGWRLRVVEGNFSNAHPSHPQPREIATREYEATFTHLILATGLNHLPRVPEIPGLASFTGQVLHSSEYRDAELHRGQRVLVVGGGESGSDIVAQLAAVARSCTLSLRSPPGTLFPKWIQGNTPDIRDDRLTYNLPRTYAPLILRGHRRFYAVQRETPELFEWAARSNYESRSCSFNSVACKSFGIPEAVVHHGARVAPQVQRIDGEQVEFSDGSREAFDTIVFATGFDIRFPMLAPELDAKLGSINRLWKNAVHPDIGEKLIVVGYARPHQINLLTTAELQARMAALVISGQRSLPSPAAMRETIAADRAYMQRYFGQRYEHNPALVDQLYFTDGLAKFIGCAVPWREVWTRDPELGLMLTYAAISGAHHRLAGPGANWELAARTIKATPLFRNRRNAMLRWSVLSLVTVAARLRAIVDPDSRSISRQARA